jgi:hypothetical protein
VPSLLYFSPLYLRYLSSGQLAARAGSVSLYYTRISISVSPFYLPAFLSCYIFTYLHDKTYSISLCQSFTPRLASKPPKIKVYLTPAELRVWPSGPEIYRPGPNPPWRTVLHTLHPPPQRICEMGSSLMFDVEASPDSIEGHLAHAHIELYCVLVRVPRKFQCHSI